jgi:DNA-binding transcriptional LysR family regulator
MDRFAAMHAFVRVVETGSFSIVAKEMTLGQPAISKTIANLERRLGARLLLRTTRKLVPTESGRAFYEQAKLAIEQAERAETIAKESHAALSGRLRVSAPTTFARLHLIPRLGHFLDRHPSLRVELVLNDEPVDLVENAVDVAIRLGTLSGSAIVARKLAETTRNVIASAEYIAKYGEPKTPQELSSHRLVSYVRPSVRETFLFSRKTETYSFAMDARVLVSAAEGVRAAVIAGLGLTIVTDWMFYPELAQGTVRKLLVDWKLPSVSLWAAFPSGKRTSAKARAFVEFFEADFRSFVRSNR